MIYTRKTKEATLLMFKKQKDQLDKSGIPYVFHPFHVAEQMNTEDEVIVALLHDLIEDTDVTIEEIKNMNFSESVVEALTLLTHDEGQDYYEYIKSIAKNEIAVKVKIADLKHNMDLNRLNEVTGDDLKRVEKYKKCVDYLENQVNIKY